MSCKPEFKDEWIEGEYMIEVIEYRKGIRVFHTFFSDKETDAKYLVRTMNARYQTKAIYNHIECRA